MDLKRPEGIFKMVQRLANQRDISFEEALRIGWGKRPEYEDLLREWKRRSKSFKSSKTSHGLGEASKVQDAANLDFSGVTDEAFLRGFRDDESMPPHVRLNAQKELSKLLEKQKAQQEKAEKDASWRPSGDAELLALAIRDVIRVQEPKTIELMKKFLQDAG